MEGRLNSTFFISVQKQMSNSPFALEKREMCLGHELNSSYFRRLVQCNQLEERHFLIHKRNGLRNQKQLAQRAENSGDMIAIYKYFRGCHVEEQLELIYITPKGKTKTNGWKNFRETDFQFYKRTTHSNSQGDPRLECAAGAGSGLHISGHRNAWLLNQVR